VGNDLRAIDPSLLTPIRDVVYETLRQAILDGSIPPGERLVESDLAETLNVSRMPVREAIRKLEAEGLVEHQPRKGAVVTTFSEEDILEIYSIREAMEALSAVQAVRRATQEEIDRLEKAMDEIDRLCEMGNGASAAEIFEANRVFSEGVIEACHMPRLVQFINTYKEYLERFRRVTLAGPARRELVRREHRAILEAIRDRDEKRAEALTRKHIRGALEAYLKSFPGKGTSAPETER
jgi:DNA-binding GntR family transcriptional regulator